MKKLFALFLGVATLATSAYTKKVDNEADLSAIGEVSTQLVDALNADDVKAIMDVTLSRYTAKKEAAPPAVSAPEPAATISPVDVQLGKVLAINHNTFTLKNVADTKAFEDIVIKEWNPAWVQHIPGYQTLLLKGDRGTKSGAYSTIISFDDLETRNYYYPTQDGSEDNVDSVAFEPIRLINQKFSQFEYIPSDTVRIYTDYVLVGGDKVDTMPLVGLLGIHELNVKAGMEEAFEAFVTDKYYPAMKGRLPGLWYFVYKGDRGADIGSYIIIAAFDSVERRNAYYPEPDKVSETVSNALDSLEDIGNEFSTYQETEEDVYTDYVIIR